MSKLNSKIPKGPLAGKWTNHKGKINLVSPSNKRNIDVIVVGTGLAGASASASLAELGYNVKSFCFQDSPRRAHSIAAQGGINAAKNYQGDGDSTYRLFYDTIKGGDYRSREANVYRLAEVSTNIIDQCVAQGVPFARDYGGLLDNRSFGGVLVSRTFYAKGQTGQQLLLGAYSAMNRQIGKGRIEMYNRHEMMDLVLEAECEVCIMHMLGEPGNMQDNPSYDDVSAEVNGYLLSKARELVERGHSMDKIHLDPGIGFGKTLEHNISLLKSSLELRPYSILWGVSRKSMIGELCNQPKTEQRLAGSLAVAAKAFDMGIDIIRVHDVREHVDLFSVLEKLEG